jgi:hypothetical protein
MSDKKATQLSGFNYVIDYHQLSTLEKKYYFCQSKQLHIHFGTQNHSISQTVPCFSLTTLPVVSVHWNHKLCLTWIIGRNRRSPCIGSITDLKLKAWGSHDLLIPVIAPWAVASLGTVKENKLNHPPKVYLWKISLGHTLLLLTDHKSIPVVTFVSAKNLSIAKQKAVVVDDVVSQLTLFFKRSIMFSAAALLLIILRRYYLVIEGKVLLHDFCNLAGSKSPPFLELKCVDSRLFWNVFQRCHGLHHTKCTQELNHIISSFNQEIWVMFVLFSETILCDSSTSSVLLVFSI